MTQIPRDEIVPWLEEDEDEDEDEDGGQGGDVIELADFSGDDLIDAGVTSGADPSNWDPIAVDGPKLQDDNRPTPEAREPGASDTTDEGVTSGNDIGKPKLEDNQPR
jgi:hypothetical protein